MPSEREKMLAGEMYDPMDPQLIGERESARSLFEQFNSTSVSQPEKRKELLQLLIGNLGEGVIIEPPLYCDYGSNISLGNNVFINFQAIILDVCEVRIGEATMLGPNVQIYTATHPIDWKERTSGLEFGKPIFIGSHCWIGGGAIICPGVTIGDRSVIGAGSVVTRDIPSDTFAAGNPCKVVRNL